MSSTIALKPYDQIFDAQKHYRTLLQSAARPGTIGQLDDVALDVPSPLNRATALLSFSLFSGDTTFSLSPAEEAATQFLRGETLAFPTRVEQADFLIFTNAANLDGLQQVRIGSLSYPDLGATVVLQVEAISPAPMSGFHRLTLSGPGIETESVIYVLGVPDEFFEFLKQCNAEFPLGVDTFLTCDSLSAGPCVLSLPRTTRIRWERI